ncbi:MAG: transposase [Terriglobia bacterium]
MGRIKRRVRQAGVYYVTAKTWQRRPVFAKAVPAKILLEQILDCRQRGFYKLHAFVIMPEHFHALLTPSGDTTLEKSMQMIKGGAAYKIRKQLDYKLPIWQPAYHDRWIRDAEEYRTRKRYIELNPVIARLVERARDYALSSANGKFVLDPSPFEAVGTSGAKAP